MSRKVDLVRLAPEASALEAAQQPDTRDASDVFRSEVKKPKLDREALAATLGVKASKFMSETELEANKAKHGERLEDGTFAGRTLREALAANKAEKEQQFQDGWKQMKQGKNRPLDEGELEWVQKLEDEEASKLRAIRAAEADGLQRFEDMQKAAVEEASSTVPVAQAGASGAGAARFAPKQRKRGRVHVAQRDGGAGGAKGAATCEAPPAGGQKHDRIESGSGAEGATTPAHGATQDAGPGGAAVLQGLLGGYGDASSDEGSGSDE